MDSHRPFICSMGIYKSLTHTWMWKLGLWPRKRRNSFSGNICFEFSVLIQRRGFRTILHIWERLQVVPWGCKMIRGRCITSKLANNCRRSRKGWRWTCRGSRAGMTSRSGHYRTSRISWRRSRSGWSMLRKGFEPLSKYIQRRQCTFCGNFFVLHMSRHPPPPTPYLQMKLIHFRLRSKTVGLGLMGFIGLTRSWTIVI